MNEQTPFGRRGFFRQGILELMRSVGKAMEPLKEAARQFADLENEIMADVRSAGESPPVHSAPPERSRPWLRPPGAVPESDFGNTCVRSGNCVSCCPVQAIRLDHEGLLGDGLPYIDPDESPCIACSGLYCMQNCPSAALLPTALLNIRMGTAVWHEASCLRTVGRGEGGTEGRDCAVCIDMCPIGSAAIRLEENRVVVLTAGCIGCGVCQHECPTRPRSIVVCPASAPVGPQCL